MSYIQAVAVGSICMLAVLISCALKIAITLELYTLSSNIDILACTSLR